MFGSMGQPLGDVPNTDYTATDVIGGGILISFTPGAVHTSQSNYIIIGTGSVSDLWGGGADGECLP